MMKKLIPLFMLCFYATTSFAIDLSASPNIRNYIQTISQKYHFDQAELTNWFNQTDFLTVTISKVNKPTKPTPFYVYRNAIITPARIKDGVNYFRQHKEILLTTQKRYGVPVEVMLGILGIESGYGINTGHYSAFQGLVTLAFNHPTRSDYFESELTSYLLLCREQGWDPLLVKSSFDGGLGLPQFMPSSYREYAVNAAQNGEPANLFESDDAIVSMGNYLSAKGWRAGEPVALPAKIISAQKARAIASNGVPGLLSLSEIKRRYGLVPQQKNIADTLKAGVLSLQTQHGLKYWLFFENFLVIKKYNNSTNYAMTIYELGRIVRKKEKGR